MKKILRYVLIIAPGGRVVFTFVYLWKNPGQRKRYTNWWFRKGKYWTKNRGSRKSGTRDEVAIVPQISGIVSELYKEAGQMVQVGEIIARIKVIPEMGTLNAAESRVTQANLNLTQARRVFDRTKENCTNQSRCSWRIRRMWKPSWNWHRKSCAMPRITWRLSGTGSQNGLQRPAIRRSVPPSREWSWMFPLKWEFSDTGKHLQCRNNHSYCGRYERYDLSGNIDETEVGRIREGMPWILP